MLAGIEYGAYLDMGSDPGHSPTLLGQFYNIKTKVEDKTDQNMSYFYRRQRPLRRHEQQDISTHADDFLVHLFEVRVDLRTVNGHATEWLVFVTG